MLIEMAIIMCGIEISAQTIYRFPHYNIIEIVVIMITLSL